MTRTVTTLITGEPATELFERQGEPDALAALLDAVREHRRRWLVLDAGGGRVGKTRSCGASATSIGASQAGVSFALGVSGASSSAAVWLPNC